MVSGKAKLIVPLFGELETGQSFNPNRFQTRRELYFNDIIEPYQELSFNIDRFLDSLSAPFYLHRLDTQQFFQKVFPSGEIFLNELAGHLNAMIASLDSVRNNYLLKSDFITWLEFFSNEVDHVLSNITSIKPSAGLDDYKQAALQVTPQIRRLWKDYYEKTFIEPEGFFSHNYYRHHPHISWTESPLAFFINTVYGNGLNQILLEYESEKQVNECIKDLNGYMSRSFEAEFYKSLTLLENNINHVKKEKRDRYVLELCSWLDILHDASIEHGIHKYYEDSLRPYKSLVYWLRLKFQSTRFPVKFRYEKEPDNYVYSTVFFEKLKQLEVPNNNGRLAKIFNKLDTKVLRNFVTGQLDNLPEITIHWKKQYFAWFLGCLQKHKPALTITALGKSSNIHFSDGSVIEANYCYSRYSQLQSAKRDKYFDLIDNIFH